ncbi:AAA family ATPase [Ruminococcus sp. HUN007]|uniref:AAA family ATPase n=1 Tax=Ruminococcus sp. HUN007 TaxID=1514668 RepID=UPI0005D1C716
MGIYLNPGNGLFEMSVNSDIYVDKSMLIDLTNSVIRTDERHICISRPRRFGKSMAANMLSAYYSRGCDSRELFRNLRISETENFEKHRNKYNVIRLDIRSYISANEDPLKIKENITEDILYEISEEYPDIKMPPRNTLEKALATVYIKTGIPFVFIIDEWDSVFRVFPQNNKAHTVYLDFLRDLLKDKEYVALDYATGIFPVKKYGEHSALNMYHEFSINDAAPYSEFMGFTEKETQALCEKYELSYDEMKDWYNGYLVDETPIYNPQSVVLACSRKIFSNYWTKTETFEALKVFIELDMDGLRQSVIRMISGEKVRVETETFQNDMTSFRSADDVMTLLIHLGYLTYDRSTGEAWIPNREVRQEFINCIKDKGWEEVMYSIRKSDDLLKATLSFDEKKGRRYC